MPKNGVEATEHDLNQLATLFRLLADKTRLSILFALVDGELSVSCLCENLNLPQPTVSHHLGLLRMNNVIGHRRAGKQVFYGLNGRVNSVDQNRLAINVENFGIQISCNNSD